MLNQYVFDDLAVSAVRWWYQDSLYPKKCFLKIVSASQ